MPGELTVRRGALSTPLALLAGRSLMDDPLEGGAELLLCELTSPATVLGAFARPHGSPSEPARVRRVSGGAWISVHPRTLYVALGLAHPRALLPCDARRIVNRHVRPLLRALTREGALAHYFGRDFVSVGHRPTAHVGFAHDSRTSRTVFESFVSLDAPLFPAARPSLLGKEPASLVLAAGRPLELAPLTARIAEAYAAAGDRTVALRRLEPRSTAEVTVRDEPPWTASVEEAVGLVAAGRDAAGVLRLGGDLLASRDAVERVAARVAALPSPVDADAVGAIVDAELDAPGVALDGVRSLLSVRQVLLQAR